MTFDFKLFPPLCIFCRIYISSKYYANIQTGIFSASAKSNAAAKPVLTLSALTAAFF